MLWVSTLKQFRFFLNKHEILMIIGMYKIRRNLYTI